MSDAEPPGQAPAEEQAAAASSSVVLLQQGGNDSEDGSEDEHDEVASATSEFDDEVIQSMAEMLMVEDMEWARAAEIASGSANLPIQPAPAISASASMGRGRSRGQAAVAAAAAAAIPQAAPAQGGAGGPGGSGRAGDAGWLPLNQRAHVQPVLWSGTTGISYPSQRNWSKKQRDELKQAQTTPIHWFKEFFDDDMVFRICSSTNLYVTAIRERPRPAGYREKWSWPPAWAVEWKPLTRQKLFEWLALSIYMACHKTSNERELWSHDWFFHRSGIRRFMTHREHQAIKAAIHFQVDDECRDSGDPQRPYLRKIGIFMELVQHKCMELYYPCQNLAFDEITIGFSGASEFRRQTKHKKDHLSMQFWAICESQKGLQYCWAFDLDRNVGEEGHKIFNAVTRLSSHLEDRVGHIMYMDNLFTSVKLFNWLRERGHGACGTMRRGRGGPSFLDGARKASKAELAAMGLTEQGRWAFSMKPSDNLLAIAWVDSGIVLFLSNAHAPDETVVKRRKAGRAGRLDIPAPVVAEQYNQEMGAVDDVDQGREGLTLRQRSVKWYHAVWWFLLDTMLGNAFTLWRKHNTTLNWRRRKWYSTLCSELLVEAGVMNNVEAQLDAPISPTILPWTLNQKSHIPKFFTKHTPEFAKRLNGQMHFVGTSDNATNRGNCALCYRTNPCKQGEKRVQHFCKQCGVWMHIACFFQWHQKAEPVSPEFATVFALCRGLARD